ncbi:MAG: SMP-30/gluconolactonase/LRE family protein [Planctomycetaceae bacterium]|jgi:sugar lactone lactonase YvrE|nr:SMP-30/gluconolactonase/LRE family protein [Planctomycetaceae bacterium]
MRTDHFPISVFPFSLTLGEGPVWDNESGRLFFLDITKKQLHRFNPNGCSDNTADEVFALETLTGCAAPCRSGNWLIAAQNGIQEVQLLSGSGHCQVKILRTLTHPEVADADNRYNDGKCSPEGRFWFGSLNMNHEKHRAALYCWDGTQCRTVLSGATNSNGLGWSPGGHTFYWIDTPTRQVEAFDYNTQDGTLSNRRTVIRFADDLSWGRPDGMTVDAAGNLWIAHWNGSCVTHWNPHCNIEQGGECLQTVPLPVLNVTSMTFGGSSLDTLYITSARSDNESASGNLFSFKPLVGGIPAGRFAY